jgi:hypothetical protein
MSGARFEVLRPRPGRGYVIEIESDHVSFASSVASPPGSTLEASAPELGIRIKVRSCKSEPLADGSPGFRIEGRFVNLSRADREKLRGST